MGPSKRGEGNLRELSWVWDLLLLWFPSELDRLQRTLAMVSYCLVLRVGLENFSLCTVSHPAHLCHRVGLSPLPVAEYCCLLFYVRFILGER